MSAGVGPIQLLCRTRLQQHCRHTPMESLNTCSDRRSAKPGGRPDRWAHAGLETSDKTWCVLHSGRFRGVLEQTEAATRL